MLPLGRVAALIILFATSTEAQELARTFDQLQVLVKLGETLTVTDHSGERARGKLSQLSTSSLTLNVSGTNREFQSTDVNIIEKRSPDSLKNGALIGLAWGLGTVVLAMARTGVSRENVGFFVMGAVLNGGIGAALGAGIDALIERRRVIYARSGSPVAKLAIAPVLSGPRKGVLVSLRLTR